jgi:TetR/AcrR family transcriptional regulator, tetracycline repressor protein
LFAVQDDLLFTVQQVLVLLHVAKAPLSVGLTRERIVTEALAVIDDEGLGSLSFRSLARRLSVNPTAIVWHVGTYEQLLSAVVSSTFLVRPKHEPTAPWQARVSDIAHSFRSDLHRHPNLAQLVGTQLATNAATEFGVFEDVLSALTDAQVPDESILACFDAFLGALVGFVVLELAQGPKHRTAEWAEAVVRKQAQIDPTLLPHLHKHREQLGGHLSFRTSSGAEAPLDDSFAALIRILITGIEAAARW